LVSTEFVILVLADTLNKAEFDIHEGIESTLMILKPRLKANNKHPEIKVIKDYANLPLIECYPGQLNQVFMNIISNAIDALEESIDTKEKKDWHAINMAISISTQIYPQGESHSSPQEEYCVIISIKDNGLGMTADTQNRIFDQFFTTKSIGKGTGLGLSISRQIIEEKHQGKISCKSSRNQGTEFIIEIPII
jgi:signal transduction histidine kinase